ncbi:DUF5674 family protein [Patescibacteria group bacterium]|nr:DUF5674 family protein [Patescibacteria group bacterium]MCL5798340.1 DUF5674 family protein [Patescibacteria group bacterium]
MKYIDHVLTKEEVKKLRNEFGDYVKITADIKKEQLVAGCILHADGERILLEKGSRQDDIWGGGINFATGEIDATAILNLRPRLNNNSIELLDEKRRKKFLATVKKVFSKLWEK